MKEKENRKTFFRGLPVHLYLCYLLLAVVLMSSVTLSKYVSEGNGGSAARVAMLVEGETSINFTVDGAGSYPGGTWMIPVTLSNHKDGKVCEVAMGYEAVVTNVTQNLPLEFTLYNDAAGSDEAEEGYWIMPAGSPQEKTFYLGVEWPEDENDARLAYEIDILEATIRAEQID